MAILSPAMSIWDRLTGLIGSRNGEEPNGPSDHEGTVAFGESRLQRQFREAMEKNDDDNRFKAAVRLMVSRDYCAGIQAFRDLASLCPERRCDCELQIGKAYTLQGQYIRSNEYFFAARIHGASEDLVDDLIWHNLELTIQKAQEDSLLIRLLNDYLTRFPGGRHVGHAKSLLNEVVR